VLPKYIQLESTHDKANFVVAWLLLSGAKTVQNCTAGKRFHADPGFHTHRAVFLSRVFDSAEFTVMKTSQAAALSLKKIIASVHLGCRAGILWHACRHKNNWGRPIGKRKQRYYP
jgi:hypothetical protein